jgi:hypothetical protein
VRSSPVLAMKPSMRPGRPRGFPSGQGERAWGPTGPAVSGVRRRRAGHATTARPRALAGPPGTSRSRPSGPESHPDWLVTDLAAVDTELGIRKIGKEADVFLLRRGELAGRSCLLAAKHYRTAEHRMVHRDSGCLEGRRTRQSRGGTGDGEPEHVRAAGHRGPTGQGRVRCAGPAVRGRAPVPTPGASAGHRAAARVHRRGGQDRRPAAGRDQARGPPSWQGCGTSWCRHSSPWPGGLRARRPCSRTTC